MNNLNLQLKPTPDEMITAQLAEVLHIELPLARLLVQRGVTDYNSAHAFFRPAYMHLHDPFLMMDMRRAVERIGCAVSNREKMMVYGDYDVDGTTAVAMVYSFLKKYADVEYYIPNRYTEGFGVSYQGIDAAVASGSRLIICLDCGTKAVEKIKYANERGVDFIVCDHHYPGAELPPAFAVLNPKRSDSNYPYRELSGCGVGFKMLQAYAQANCIPDEEVNAYIDLVAVSIASDVVPMDGENRVLAALGMKKLNSNPGLGLKSIVKIAGLDRSQRQIDDVVFKIGPRINAAGRMKSGRHAVELLISDEEHAARLVGAEIDRYNTDRKNVDAEITHQALRMMATDPEQEHRHTTVLYNPEWHKGVVGIVASRLIDTWYRPTVILTESEGKATGSARSVEGFDLYQAIDACSDLLENFGGHMYAAGLTMKIENIAAFSKRFDEAVAATITGEQLMRRLTVDAEIMFADITPKFVRILKQFQPFGPCNMSPVFLTRRVTDVGNAKIVGKSGDHLKLDLHQEGYPTIVFPAIGFHMGDRYPVIRTGEPFDVCYTIEENTFRDVTQLQLQVKAIGNPTFDMVTMPPIDEIDGV